MMQEMDRPSKTGDVSHIIVCVTGVTGYVAEPIVKLLLEKGYTVRGTVRDPTKTDRLKELAALPGASERLTFHRADLEEPGSFDDVVNGSTYVIHTASPVHGWLVTNADAVIRPAVEGTRNVLGAVLKTNTVRRVVLTSSIRSIFGYADEHPPGYLYTEEDWNTRGRVEDNQGYALSKLLSEKAAWEMAEKSDGSWDLITIHPGIILGPPLSPHHEHSFSIEMFKGLATGHQPVIKMGWPMVDIRDVAKAHVAAIENLNAKGRYLVCAETMTHREIVNQVRDKVRRPLMRFSVPKPFLYIGYYTGLTGGKVCLADIKHNVGQRIYFSTEKVKRDLLPEGFISMKDSCRDMYDVLVAQGIISAKN